MNITANISSFKKSLCVRTALMVIYLCFCLMPSQAQTVSLPDTNFLKFIQKNYPSVISQGNRLIISEAAKVGGWLVCTNQNIQNVEGIQYFTSVSSIDLSNNQLRALPSLIKNDTIRTVVLNNNKLTKLPDFSKWSKLVSIDIVDNQLSELSGLNGLKRLQKLICKGNLLTSIPVLDSLKQLSALDVSYNKLTSFPVLPKSNKIQSLHLNNNALSSLPDSFYLPQLVKLWLYYNDLTFGDLAKLKPRGLDSLTVISPQNSIKVESKLVLKEQDALSIASLTDTTLPTISYKWFHNGTLVKSSDKDGLYFPNVSFQDSGKYVCAITDALFPHLTLYTDTFYLKVQPCLDLKTFSYSSTSSNCKRSGTVQIKSSMMQKLSYSLKSPVTGEIITSSDGQFRGLSEPLYSLSIKTVNGCEKEFPEEIKVGREECKQVLITPNGDGEADSFFFPQNGLVSIYDKRGSLVKTFSIPSEWDGNSKAGRVAPGYYLADINNGEELMNISVVY